MRKLAVAAILFPLLAAAPALAVALPEARLESSLRLRQPGSLLGLERPARGLGLGLLTYFASDLFLRRL